MYHHPWSRDADRSRSRDGDRSRSRDGERSRNRDGYRPHSPDDYRFHSTNTDHPRFGNLNRARSRDINGPHPRDSYRPRSPARCPPHSRDVDRPRTRDGYHTHSRNDERPDFDHYRPSYSAEPSRLDRSIGHSVNHSVNRSVNTTQEAVQLPTNRQASDPYSSRSLLNNNSRSSEHFGRRASDTNTSRSFLNDNRSSEHFGRQASDTNASRSLLNDNTSSEHFGRQVSDTNTSRSLLNDSNSSEPFGRLSLYSFINDHVDEAPAQSVPLTQESLAAIPRIRKRKSSKPQVIEKEQADPSSRVTQIAADTTSTQVTQKAKRSTSTQVIQKPTNSRSTQVTQKASDSTSTQVTQKPTDTTSTQVTIKPDPELDIETREHNAAVEAANRAIEESLGDFNSNNSGAAQFSVSCDPVYLNNLEKLGNFNFASVPPADQPETKPVVAANSKPKPKPKSKAKPKTSKATASKPKMSTVNNNNFADMEYDEPAPKRLRSSRVSAVAAPSSINVVAPEGEFSLRKKKAVSYVEIDDEEEEDEVQFLPAPAPKKPVLGGKRVHLPPYTKAAQAELALERRVVWHHQAKGDTMPANIPHVAIDIAKSAAKAAYTIDAYLTLTGQKVPLPGDVTLEEALAAEMVEAAKPEEVRNAYKREHRGCKQYIRDLLIIDKDLLERMRLAGLKMGELEKENRELKAKLGAVEGENEVLRAKLGEMEGVEGV